MVKNINGGSIMNLVDDIRTALEQAEDAAGEKAGSLRSPEAQAEYFLGRAQVLATLRLAEVTQRPTWGETRHFDQTGEEIFKDFEPDRNPVEMKIVVGDADGKDTSEPTMTAKEVVEAIVKPITQVLEEVVSQQAEEVPAVEIDEEPVAEVEEEKPPAAPKPKATRRSTDKK